MAKKYDPREKGIDERLSQIARDHLSIETLDERGRDSLDFHDVGVASLKTALRAAYDLGRQTRD